MNPHHRAIRAMLVTMAPRRAMEFVEAFQLLPDEQSCIVEVDILGRSRLEVALRHHMSVETVDERRRRGYRKISDWIENQ